MFAVVYYFIQLQIMLQAMSKDAKCADGHADLVPGCLHMAL